MGLFVYVRLLFCFITAYAPEKVDVGVFWTSFLEKFFRFDEKNSCLIPGVCYTDGAYAIPEWR